MQHSECEKTQNKTLEIHPPTATIVPEWRVAKGLYVTRDKG